MTESPNDDRPVALISGGARGIGAATARRLASTGWRVALVDRADGDRGLGYAMAGRGDLDGVVFSCDGLGGPGSAAGRVADVRDEAGLRSAVDDLAGHFGRLDAVIAGAGAIAGGPSAWETDAATWEAMVAVNLTGVWHLARAGVPHLLARPEPRSGRFVAVASAASLEGLPQLAAYTAAKAGVVGLVRALAAELGPMGITANAVCPGSTRTPMLDASAAIYGLESVEEFARHHAIGRLLEPEEVAAAVAALCSPDSSAVTGAVLAVDGGMTAT